MTDSLKAINYHKAKRINDNSLEQKKNNCKKDVLVGMNEDNSCKVGDLKSQKDIEKLWEGEGDSKTHEERDGDRSGQKQENVGLFDFCFGFDDSASERFGFWFFQLDGKSEGHKEPDDQK